MANIITMKDLVAPAFMRAWNDIFYKRKSTICCDGGRGSGKSSALAVFLFLILEMHRRIALDMKKRGMPNWKSELVHAVVIRKVANTLADSVYNNLQWACEKLGLSDKYVFKKTPLMIERRGTGQRIVFRGLDDPARLKSLKVQAFGYPKIFWAEELAEYDSMEEILDVKRSIQRGGHDFLTFYSYNPPETTANWVNYAVKQYAAKDPLFGSYHSDYRSVPREWLGDDFFREANTLLKINERAYRHIYLGEITGNGGTVFPNVREIQKTPELMDWVRNSGGIRWGCDFGLRDPTVLVGVCYDHVNHRLVIFDEIYKSDMTLDDMEREFNAHHFGYEYIIADSAGATLITTLRARGMDIIPCTKGPGSIESGIKWLQSLTSIDICSCCEWTLKEFLAYEYEKNKAGEFTGRLPDVFNHAVDAVRYSISKLATQNTWF